jgi:hypothetical protein
MNSALDLRSEPPSLGVGLRGYVRMPKSMRPDSDLERLLRGFADPHADKNLSMLAAGELRIP